MTALLWFRRDLRLSDHPALVAAAEEGPVLPVHVRDPAFEPSGELPRRRRDASLVALRDATDGALVVRSGDSGAVIVELAEAVGADRVHVTADATPAGRRRDQAVAARLERRGMRLVSTSTGYAVPPGTLRTASRTSYQVFTPFSRAWRDHGAPPPLPAPAVRWARGPSGEPGAVRVHDDGVPGEGTVEMPGGGTVEMPGEGTVEMRGEGGPGESTRPGDVRADPGESAGEASAWTRWHEFVETRLDGYAQDRDRPDLDGSSRMSAALAWGEVHPRQLLAELAGHPDSDGRRRFVDELCWREFCADVLWSHPDSAWSDLRPELAGLEHDRVGPEVEAWRQGRTGFPFVDAGMRQLRELGWMHNRARMTAASFLVKDLHAPWQVGARHFLDLLVDGDLASNTHNWQWVAGTGTDAAPYHRIFNPVRQGLRFDPEGEYVRRWVPELAHLPGAAAHEPWRHGLGYAAGYPLRIVDHDEERREALARHARARGRG